jgi:ribosomal protein S1
MNQQPRVAAPEGGGDEFRKLFEESMRAVKPGEVVRGRVVNIGRDQVTVDIGTSPKDRSRSVSSAPATARLRFTKAMRSTSTSMPTKGEHGGIAVPQQGEQAKVWRDIEEAFRTTESSRAHRR